MKIPTFDIAEDNVVEAFFVLEVVLVLNNEGVAECRMSQHLSREVLVVLFVLIRARFDPELLHGEELLCLVNRYTYIIFFALNFDDLSEGTCSERIHLLVEL
jgi:hypothetical protein